MDSTMSTISGRQIETRCCLAALAIITADKIADNAVHHQAGSLLDCSCVQLLVSSYFGHPLLTVIIKCFRCR